MIIQMDYPDREKSRVLVALDPPNLIGVVQFFCDRDLIGTNQVSIT